MVRRGHSKASQSGVVRSSRSTVAGATTCKTCTSCRQKKIKCDGARPQCEECVNNSLTCSYPHDARRQPRPSRARMESLEATVSAMLEHMKASGIVLTPFEGEDCGEGSQEPAQVIPDTPGSLTKSILRDAVPLPSPTASTDTNRLDAQHKSTPNSNFMYSNIDVEEGSNNVFTASYEHNPTPPQDQTQTNEQALSEPLSENNDNFGAQEMVESAPESPGQEEFPGTDLSPCEARVAGVFHEGGRVASVHGLAGIINPTLRAQHKENISKVCRRGEAVISATKARLISNAALQRQREGAMFRQPQQQSLDLDGCCPELAKHLLDIHFSRQDSTRLTLYRPAIMGCIANGGGPWVNKLLLNAIFYSNSLYSERLCFRSSDGPKEKGSHFYDRFRHLLVEELGQPSIPTASALLLTSTSLMSRGKNNESWVLSGMAYRMIVDLGCHLMLAPDYEETSKSQSQSGSYQLHRDMEQEMRKRLYWGAYVTDVTQSLYLGRPCMFATQEARVPLRFLDTFEEMDEWRPYMDPMGSVGQGTYEPQPAHTLSTFTSLIRVMQIATQICDLYGIHAMKYDSKYVLEKKSSIEMQLQKWSSGLPKHLVFDPQISATPPPHQITPFTMFHTLQILLHRAFMEEGHLRRHSDPEMKRQSEESCIASAIMISKYVEAYRNAFTLRTAPYLISYAVYSAATVVLRQERHDRGHFIDTISFLWTCLGELSEGCHFGLQRPMAILRDMVQEFYQTARQKELENSDDQTFSFRDLDRSLFSHLPLSERGSVHEGSTPSGTFIPSDDASFVDYSMAMEQLDFGFDSLTPCVPGFLTDEESNVSQNYLYGLFAP